MGTALYITIFLLIITEIKRNSILLEYDDNVYLHLLLDGVSVVRCCLTAYFLISQFVESFILSVTTSKHKLTDMDLELANQRFVVCGASGGFGRAIAEQLLEEGAKVIAIARRQSKLNELARKYPQTMVCITGDLQKATVHNQIEHMIGSNPLHGIVFNAGGPPTGSALSTTMKQWDKAYHLVLRWKIDLALRLVPRLVSRKYGRVLFIESQSVKQPVEDLVLSNAMRMAVVGFAKTLSHEIASSGVTVNIIAPGSHDSPAIERVVKSIAERNKQSISEAKETISKAIPVGRMGKPEELASLAAWILSPHAGFVTGQTISHDGGNINFVFG